MASQASFFGSRLSPCSSSSVATNLSQSTQRAACEPPVTVRLEHLIRKFGLVLAALDGNQAVDRVYRELHESISAAQTAATTFLKEQPQALVDTPKVVATPARKDSFEQEVEQMGTLTVFRETINGLQTEMREIAASLPRGKKSDVCRDLTECLCTAKTSIRAFLTSFLVDHEGKVPALAAKDEEAKTIKSLNALQTKVMQTIRNLDKVSCLQTNFGDLKHELDSLMARKYTSQKVAGMLEINETLLSLLRLRMLQELVIVRIYSDIPFSKDFFEEWKEEVEVYRSAWAINNAPSEKVGEALKSIKALFGWIDCYCDESSKRAALRDDLAQLRQEVEKLFEEFQKGDSAIGANEQALVILRGRLNTFKEQQQQLVQKLDPEKWPSALSELGVKVEEHILAKRVCDEIQALTELVSEIEVDIGFTENQYLEHPGVLIDRLQAMLNEFVPGLRATDAFLGFIRDQNRKLDGYLQETPSAEPATPPPGFTFKLNDKSTSPSDVLKSLQDVMGTAMLVSTKLTELKDGRQGLVARIPDIKKNVYVNSCTIRSGEKSRCTV